MTEVRRQRMEFGSGNAEFGIRKKIEDRSQRTDDRAEKSEVGIRKAEKLEDRRRRAQGSGLRVDGTRVRLRVEG